MLILHHYYRRAMLSAMLLSFILSARPQDSYSSANTGMQFNRAASSSGNSGQLTDAASISPSLYTGGLQISLPIYTIKSSDLAIPISISYTASNGVRPTDPNTIVGMDWALMAGGNISRVVRGLPDESTYGYLGTNQEGATAVSDYNSPSASKTQGFNNSYNQNASKPIVDGEPDIFIISTPTFGAQFTIDPVTGNAVFIGGSNGLQVVHNLFNNSGGYPPYSITVIDPQGTQYIFGSQAREMTTTKFFGTSYPAYISTWYLDQIILLNSKDVINFSYLTGKDDSVYTASLSCDYTDVYPQFFGFPPASNITPTSQETVSGDNRTVQYSLTIYNGPKYIQTISTKQGEADFAYATPGNAYIYTSDPPELSTITIKQFNPVTNTNSTVLKTFNLSFTDIETGIEGVAPPFTNFWPGWDDYHRRLLSTVTVTGNTAATSTPLTLYNLTYYQSLPYPDRLVPYAVDYWGYANTNITDVNALNALRYNYFYQPGSNRNPASIPVSGQSQNVPMAAMFALQQISQLTGGTTTINYQQNDYYNGTSTQSAGGIRVSSIVSQLPTGESLTTNYSYVDANGNSTGQLWSNLYSNVTMFFGSACCDLPGLTYNQSPYGIADENGVIVGYSSVKVTSPNGGYTISNFTNFSDYPDVISQPSSYAIYNTSSTYGTAVSEQLSSFAYKRGLPTTTKAYNVNGNIVSLDSNTYGTVGPAAIPAEIGIQDMTWWQNLSAGYSSGNVLASVNIYHDNFENWRLMQTFRQTYDQVTPTTYLQTTTSYSYAPDNWQVRSVSTTDSKGQNFTQTYYYADDANIPFATSSEQSMLAVLSASGTRTSAGVNAASLLIHEIDNRNGSIHQTHYTYSPVTLGAATNYYLTTTTRYTGNTSVIQQFTNYDASTSQPISSYATGGKSTSAIYGYNAAYPVVKIDNAANTTTLYNQSANQTGYINFQGGQSGSLNANVTTTAAGTITVTLPFGDYLTSNVTCRFSVSLSLNGTVVGSGQLCISDVSGYTCQGSTTLTFPNMAVGTYSLVATAESNNAATNSVVTIQYSYAGMQESTTGSTEFFFEGFEQNSLATAGSAHTGNMYYTGTYACPYNPPNSRKYLIQWWNLSNGQWIFNQQPYTAYMTLAGPVDDVRIFPSDALMTTYTYSPLLGQTSATDPSGKSIIYEYDGLGRLQDTRDQNGNLLNQYSYQYQVGLSN